MSITYHPQTDRQTERVNQTLEQYLRCYVDKRQSDWSKLLGPAEFAYNNATHEGTKNSPFFLEYGRHPRAGLSLDKEPKTSDMLEIAWQHSEAQEQAKASMELAAERMKWYYDKSIQKVPFKIGDTVMVDLKDYVKTGQKLQPKFYGPFKIIKQVSPVNFELKWPSDLRKYHPVFHASKLIPYNEPTFKGQKFKKPDSEIINELPEFEVERILDSQRKGRFKDPKKNKLYYFVRWKGYGLDDDSWEPVQNLQNSQEVIEDFHKLYPEAANTAEVYCYIGYQLKALQGS
jgi:hypothetical protein